MAVFEWLDRRKDLMGWASWKAVIAAVGLSDDDFDQLQCVDDLSVLKSIKVRKLARAMGVTGKILRRLDQGANILVDMPPVGWQPPISFYEECDRGWPPPSDELESGIPQLGQMLPTGRIESVEPSDQFHSPRIPVDAQQSSDFAIEVWPPGRWAILRKINPETLRNDSDVALFAWNGHEPQAWYGRLELTADHVYLRVGRETIQIDPASVIGAAKEVDSFVPPPTPPREGQKCSCGAGFQPASAKIQKQAGMPAPQRARGSSLSSSADATEMG